jgi:hypothetical protein
LPAIRPLNEALHLILPQIVRESYRQNHLKQDVFTQPGSLATSYCGSKSIVVRLPITDIRTF